MSNRYNVYYAGQVREGMDPAVVRQNLGKLFKADAATLDKLFSGKIQLLKRDCDEPMAQKYKAAMERAGAQPILRAMQEEEDPAQGAPQRPANSAPADAGRPMTAAEKIAALAAAEDDRRFQANAEPTPEEPPEAPAYADKIGLIIEPVGSAILRDNERTTPPSVNVDVSALEVDDSAQRLSAEPPPPPPAPDTSQLDMGEVGDSIPNLPSSAAPLDPDTSALDLDPAQTGFEDCAAPPAPPPQLDLSGLDLAATGSDVLEERYRRRETPPPPATDHLSLDD